MHQQTLPAFSQHLNAINFNHKIPISIQELKHLSNQSMKKTICTTLLGLLCLTAACPRANAQFNHYYGNTHSHTWYSDGNKEKINDPNWVNDTPLESFQYADAAQRMDFLGISDHNHNEGNAATSPQNMTLARYHAGVNDATAANNAAFIAMYGMEWGTISTGGHLNVYGMGNNLIGWQTGLNDIFVAKGDYLGINGIMSKVAATPNAFVTACHPNTADYDNLIAAATPFNANADKAFRAVAVKSGSNYNASPTSVNYNNYNGENTAITYFDYYRDVLAKGYHVGAIIDHDNHYSNFGASTQARTAILATSLSPANIADAFMNRRFFATDDWTAKIDFRINALIMGTINAQNANPAISISITDGEITESVANIQLYYGIPGSGARATILSANTATNTLNFTHTIAVNAEYYYFFVITQGDGDDIISSPIWFKKAVPLDITLSAFDLRLNNQKQTELQWTSTSETNSSHFDIERSPNGIHFETIGSVLASGNTSEPKNYVFVDDKPLKQKSFYRLKMQDLNGKSQYSEIKTIFVVDKSNLMIVTNPQTNTIEILNWNETMNLRAVGVLGQAYPLPRLAFAGSFDTSLLPAGIYILVDETGRFGKFIKQ